MKVSNSGQGSAEKTRGVVSTERTKGAGEGKGKKEKGQTVDTGVAEKVSISGRAKETSRAKEMAKAAPDVDESKVARLKAQIQNGTYKVDEDQLADRMVDEHLVSGF